MSRTSLAIAGVLAVWFAQPALSECKVQQLAQLPVTMQGLKPTVTARIGGRDVRLLADSGAFFSVLSPGTAAELKLPLKPAPPNFYLKGMGGTASVSITTIKDFAVSGIMLGNTDFLVGGSEVSGLAGVLGQNVLAAVDVEYDLAGGMIRLIKPADCAGVNLAYWSAGKPISVLTIEPIGPQNRHIRGEVIVNGVKLRALFDTGAPTTVMSLRAAARAGVKPGDPGVEEAGLARGIGMRSSPGWIGPFASIKIGDEEVRRTRLRFVDLGADLSLDIVVGADFFLSHRIYVAISQRRMTAPYNGGAVFQLDRPIAIAAGTPAKASDPGDAEGFSRRGAALAARRDFAGAIADYDRAIERAPIEPRYYVQRAAARSAAGQLPGALEDLDRAIALKPDPDTFLARSFGRFALGDRARARGDLDAAAAAAPREADYQFALGNAYLAFDAHDKAAAHFDQWIAVHPQDSRRRDALNAACWARALAGHELQKALEQCNSALRMQPKAADARDSRGLVWLRLGDLDKAIADYDAALAINPKMDWSLYGRGVARLRRGQKAAGEADIVAAAAINGKLPDRAKKIGLAPPT